MLFEQFLHGNLIDLHVLLDHHLLERLEVVDRENLLDDSAVRGIACTGLARSLELLSCNAHLSN